MPGEGQPLEQHLIWHPRYPQFPYQDDQERFRPWWRQHQKQQPHPHFCVELPSSSDVGSHVQRPPIARQRGRDAQVNPALVIAPVALAPSMDQNPRLLNVGPKPAKCARDTPLSAFKTDLVLHYRATELPRQKRGIANLAFHDNECKTTFLARLAPKRGLQMDPIW